MIRIVFSAIVYLIIAGFINFLIFGGFVKMINDASTVSVELLLIFIFWLVLGGFAGIICDDVSERTIHYKIHKKFFLFGLSSFFKKVRHEFICDKCF